MDMFHLGMHPAERPVLEALEGARGVLTFERLLKLSGLTEKGLRTVLSYLQRKGAVFILYAKEGELIRLTPRGRTLLARGVDPVLDELPF